MVCGLMEMSPEMGEMPPVWGTYVATDDADATVQRVTDAGGTVMIPPMDVMDVGRMAVFADPTGAVLGLWQAKTHKGAELVNEPYGFAWNELNTRDTAAASAFYQAVFGWRTEALDGPMEYCEWKLGDNTIGGMMPMPAEMPAMVPPFWLNYFAVEDCDASLARVIELGGGSMFGAVDIAAGRFAVVHDPAGASFAIIKLAQNN
jgi:predicted enzyme related to lactoylglutathione lyase